MALFRQMISNQGCFSPLCVGLDPEPQRFPAPWADDTDRIFDFCAGVVDATHDLVLAFKPQIAHFAAQRAEAQLERLIAYIHQRYPGIPVILDAKRGDVGHTAEMYAQEAFVRYAADAVTLSPFLGPDAIEPFLRYDGKGIFLLDRTSNSQSDAVQGLKVNLTVEQMKAIAKQIGDLSVAPSLSLAEWLAYAMTHDWGISQERLGLVVGATHPGAARRMRQLAGPIPMLLIPGVGAQGGSEADAMAAYTHPGSVIINASRSILYAPSNPGQDWRTGPRSAALSLRGRLNHHCTTTSRQGE